MPEALTKHISESTLPQAHKDKMIWFSCEGENPADKEHIGPIDYYPNMGVPTYFYPYKNQEGYNSPAVFAHFSNPKRKYFWSRWQGAQACAIYDLSISKDQLGSEKSINFLI